MRRKPHKPAWEAGDSRIWFILNSFQDLANENPPSPPASHSLLVSELVCPEVPRIWRESVNSAPARESRERKSSESAYFSEGADRSPISVREPDEEFDISLGRDSPSRTGHKKFYRGFE